MDDASCLQLLELCLGALQLLWVQPARLCEDGAASSLDAVGDAIQRMGMGGAGDYHFRELLEQRPSSLWQGAWQGMGNLLVGWWLYCLAAACWVF